MPRSIIIKLNNKQIRDILIFKKSFKNLKIKSIYAYAKYGNTFNIFAKKQTICIYLNSNLAGFPLGAIVLFRKNLNFTAYVLFSLFFFFRQLQIYSPLNSSLYA